MPELPEVETVKRGLSAKTLDRKITGGEVLLPRTIAHPSQPDEFLDGLQGGTIAAWHRRGKYLYAEITKKHQLSGYWGVHLRMTGQLLWVNNSEPIAKHTRVRLFLEPDVEIRFIDQRTFGKMWWIPSPLTPPEIISGLTKLGPEPFDREFTIEYFQSKLSKSHRAIKTAILDQNLVAGLGNIYADECLFLSKIHPTTPAHSLTLKQITNLHQATIQVLTTAIECGGTTFSNYLNVEGINGNYGGEAWVYHRDRQPCRICGTEILKIRLGGRGTHYCPQCQPLNR
jgi:formamidopyrimidine-DNA glycosylase